MSYGKKSPVYILKKFCNKDGLDDEETEIYNMFMNSLASTQVSDAINSILGVSGVLKGVKAVNNQKMFGRIFTAKTNSNDWGTSILATDDALDGDVLLIQTIGENIAVWGELASVNAKKQGIAGAIIYGASRDTDVLVDMDFPVYSLDKIPNAGSAYGFGELAVDLEIDGMTIKTGDYAFADENGVVIIPQSKFDLIFSKAIEIKDMENEIAKELEEKTLSQIVGISKE